MDQREEIRILEVFASVGLPLAKINFGGWYHWDRANTLTVVEPGAMNRKAKASLIPPSHPRHCGVVTPVDSAINMCVELTPRQPRQLFQVLTKCVETGAAILKRFVDLRQTGNLMNQMA